jgi:ABC-2 type transport system permease protein
LFRDPVQIIQGLLFFGLLGIYFFNLRNLHYHLLEPVWRNLIAFLNLFSLAAIMCSFCSRFVFPQISLEGHAFWIIGLSPAGMGRVLKIKFMLAVFMMLIISGALMTISSLMLSAPPHVVLITFMTAAAASFALCGLALGLGALYMDLEHTNPVAIISGFGGTFNLVLSLAYIIAAVFPFGLISHEYVAGHISRAWFMAGLSAAGGWLVLLTALTAALPLSAGYRRLVSREY